MSRGFHIGVNTSPEILANPPPQFRHLNVVFAPFAVSVGDVDFPASFWTDFAGVWLFKWYWAVWKLAEGQSRYARLPFWYTYEMWLRRTTKQWWRLSLVECEGDDRNVIYETLLIPEVVESALLSAIQKLIDGTKQVGIWTEDCAALEALLNERGEYFEALEAGTIRPPTFLTKQFAVPISANPRPYRSGRQSPRVSPWENQSQTPPVLCPHCTAVLSLWNDSMQQQTCDHCGRTVLR